MLNVYIFYVNMHYVLYIKYELQFSYLFSILHVNIKDQKYYIL